MHGAFQRLRAEAIAGLSFIYPLLAMLADYAVFDTLLGQNTPRSISEPR